MNSFLSKKSKVLISVVLLIALAATGFYAFKKLSGGDIVLEIEPPGKEVKIGVPFDINVRFANDSQNTLGNVRVAFELPQNIISIDGKEGVITKELGDISSGGVHQESFSVIATPAENPEYTIHATAFYSPASLVAEFRKKAEMGINVERPDFDLTLQAPEKIFPSEEFEAKVLYERRDETEGLPDIILNLKTPQGFQRLEADPTPETSDNKWILGKVERGEKKYIIIRGKVGPSSDTSFDIAAELAMKILDEEYPFIVRTQTVAVEPSPLSFQLALADHGDIVQSGEQLRFIVSYRNNTEVDMQDVVIRAQLIGEMFDISSLETGARFNNLTNTIMWSSGDFEELRRLSAGAQGQMTFSIGVKDEYPIERLSDKNFTLKVGAEIESPTVPYLINAEKTVNTSSIEMKVAGKIEVLSKALFRDAQSGIVNSGPFPPQAGVPTNYTIHWTVRNLSTDVDGVEVRAHLEDGVSFTAKVKSNTESEPYFDSESGEVVWRLGRLVATTGVLSESPEAVFQIEAIPKQSHRGKYMPLIAVTEIRGSDEFTGQTIAGTYGLIDTRLYGDPTVGEGAGLVR